MQVRSNDFKTGMGMQTYAGLNGLFYSNTGIQFNTSSIVRDKDYPTGGTNAGQFAANGAFIAQASLASTSNATGSIQVVGGIGVKGNVYADAVYADAVYDGGVEIIVQANAAFLAANTPSYTANSAASYANGAFTRANNAINANTGGTITGDLSITGNLTVTGNTTYIDTRTITTQDSLIRLANNNIIGDVIDIGFYGVANTILSTAPTYHGLVRNAGANTFFLFKGLTADPSSNTLASGSITPANTATLIANVQAYSITSNGVDIFVYTTNAYTQANTSGTNATNAGSYANSAFAVANNGVGIDTTQNTNITAASSYANAAFAAANTAATEPNALAFAIALG
jgi:hypothetical protein